MALRNNNAVDCSRVYTVCLHLEQAFETLLKEMKIDTDVLEETFPSYNLNFYFPFLFLYLYLAKDAHRTKVNNNKKNDEIKIKKK